jgi:subtilase family protein
VPGGQPDDVPGRTSFSSPYAAAAVAIEHAVCRADTPAQLRTRLEATAQDLGTAGRDDFFGAGLIRPDLAVAAC